MQLLNGLLDKSLTFREVEENSQSIKSIQCTRDAFLKGVDLETWEEARERVYLSLPKL